MNIKIMRRLDYWIGIPLCLCLSGLNYLYYTLRIFLKVEISPVKKVLFIKLSELGAIILAYPLLKQIKDKYASTELFFVTFQKNKDVFALLSGIIPESNIFIIRQESLVIFVYDTLGLIKTLRKKKIDVVFDLEFFSRFGPIFGYLSGAKKRIGFYHYAFEGLYRGSLLTHKVQYNPLNHISKNYLSLACGMKMYKKSTPEIEEEIKINDFILPQYISNEETAKKIRTKLNVSVFNSANRLFLINPGEGILSLREWPLENFITLSKQILEDDIHNFIIIVGTEGVINKGELIFRALDNPKCINLIGKTSLTELMELFSLAEILISNDCGLAHLAMLTSVKKFIIFGPESPQIFGPLGNNNWVIYSKWPCSPCLSALNHRVSICKNNVCLKTIKPEYVHALIQGVVYKKMNASENRF